MHAHTNCQVAALVDMEPEVAARTPHDIPQVARRSPSTVRATDVYCP